MPGAIPDLNIDLYQIMPNHIHAIVFIEYPVGSGTEARPQISQQVQYGKDQSTINESHISLFNVVARFKSLTTNRYIHGVRDCGWSSFEQKLWQRSFYGHVIRNKRDYQAIADYILMNPLNWEKDEEYRLGK